MLLVGLTGGIGSGKSTAARYFARRGAVLVDADQVARSLMEPGGPAFDPVVRRFGQAIVRESGESSAIDRQALAREVFGDPGALADLERIVHPLVWEAIRTRLAVAGDEAVAVIELPLLGREGERSSAAGGTDPTAGSAAPYRRVPLPGGCLHWIVVVDCPPEQCLERLVKGREMTPADAKARAAAQPGREKRLEIADVVLDNSGSTADLERQVGQAWQLVTTATPPGGPS